MMCAVVTKGTFVGIFVSKKIHFYKAVQNILKFFSNVNLLINIVYIDLYTHIYIVPNQAICVAKLCFYYFVSIKNTGLLCHVTLTLTLSCNF